MTKPRVITVFTHQYPGETAGAIRRLAEEACAAGIQVRLSSEEAQKHRLPERSNLVLDADPSAKTDLAVVLGGDGTILLALRAFANRKVPVFAFNFGQIGFLSTVDRDGLDDGLRRVVEGDFEVRAMPVLVVDTEDGEKVGVNDISFHRRPNSRVAELQYSVRGEALGAVRCDGLVLSTPVGSTGYNLANGGPILAWGVEGYVVSFVAPHTLTARALVVAPDDPLTVTNLSARDSVDVTTDGRTVRELGPKQSLDVRFREESAWLAQIPGATFYHQIREKFGRLAS
ncbi:MAG TPA: NAD(+)/NADH kinase [Thermoleophilaceae bacterium]|nr:NAD(+)/NADH kinase [Thermoleophilaceae bacterium]